MNTRGARPARHRHGAFYAAQTFSDVPDGPRKLLVNGIDARFEGRNARIFTDRTSNEVHVDDGRVYELRTRPPSNFESTE